MDTVGASSRVSPAGPAWITRTRTNVLSPPAPDRPGVDTPCVLASSRDKLGFAALFSTFCVPDTGRTLYTLSLI